MTGSEDDIDWSLTTFEGSRREQLRRWRSLTLRQRLEALDRMSGPLAQPLGRDAGGAPAASERATEAPSRGER